MRHPNGSVTQTKYLPFGGYRGGSGGNPITDRGYTGHKHNDSLGLIYMNARYYSPYINRFISADTIIPNPTNPQSYNRYSYVRNSPLNRVDPSGHVDCAMLGDLSDSLACNSYTPRPTIPNGDMVDFTGSWRQEDEDGNVIYDEEWKQADIQQAAVVLGRQFARILNQLHPGWNLTSREAFLLVYGGTVRFNHMGREATNGIRGLTNGRNDIDVYSGGITYPVHWAIHELGHAFNHAIGGVGDDMLLASRAKYDIPIRTGYSADDQFGFAGTHSPHFLWQHSTAANDAGEEFADMMIGWAYNRWELREGIAHPPYSTVWSLAGQGRSNFMADNMALLLSLAIDR